jgi:hypothetical protein
LKKFDKKIKYWNQGQTNILIVWKIGGFESLLFNVFKKNILRSTRAPNASQHVPSCHLDSD